MLLGRYLNMENRFNGNEGLFRFFIIIIGNILNFIVTWVVLLTLMAIIAMIITNFFNPSKDHEVVDTSTEITVPEQSLSVRDILTRFSRGQIEIPPIDYGEDDDINADLSNYDDLVDAQNAIFESQNNLETIKRSELEKAQEAKEQSVQAESAVQSDTLES